MASVGIQYQYFDFIINNIFCSTTVVVVGIVLPRKPHHHASARAANDYDALKSIPDMVAAPLRHSRPVPHVVAILDDYAHGAFCCRASAAEAAARLPTSRMAARQNKEAARSRKEMPKKAITSRDGRPASPRTALCRREDKSTPSQQRVSDMLLHCRPAPDKAPADGIGIAIEASARDAQLIKLIAARTA